MKLLFENWRKYITEGEAEEFGPTLMQDIKDCAGNPTSCLKKKGYKLLGGGSFRDVFELIKNKDYILKVATDPKGKMMNSLEADYRMQRNFSDLIPKTYKHSEDYKWVIIERVYPWGGSNEAWIKAFFPAFADKEFIKTQTSLPTNTVWDFFDDFSKDMVEMVKSGDQRENDKINELFVPVGSLGDFAGHEEKSKAGYAARRKFETKLNPLYKRFIDLASQYNIEFWDIVAKNVGTRKDGSFVLLDLSAFPEGL